MHKKLIETCKKVFNKEPLKIIEVSKALLGGQIFKIEFTDFSIHAVTGVSEEELNAQKILYEFFVKYHIPLVKIHYINPKEGIIFQDYLTTKTLLDVVNETRNDKINFSKTIGIYKKVISDLVVMQIDGGVSLLLQEKKKIIPYNDQKINDDLKYFLKDFLPYTKIDYDSSMLISDFNKFSKYLASFGTDYFYYRDLMTRNVLVKDGEPYFIDYQGGRDGYIGCMSGALQPSIVSLLNHSRANLPRDVRSDLLNFYISEVKERIELDEQSFLEAYSAFSILKNLQNLGTYGHYGYAKGLDGYDGGKAKFLSNIPAVLKELQYELNNYEFSSDLSYFSEICSKVSVFEDIE